MDLRSTSGQRLKAVHSEYVATFRSWHREACGDACGVGTSRRGRRPRRRRRDRGGLRVCQARCRQPARGSPGGGPSLARRPLGRFRRSVGDDEVAVPALIHGVRHSPYCSRAATASTRMFHAPCSRMPPKEPPGDCPRAKARGLETIGGDTPTRTHTPNGAHAPTRSPHSDFEPPAFSPGGLRVRRRIAPPARTAAPTMPAQTHHGCGGVGPAPSTNSTRRAPAGWHRGTWPGMLT